MAIIENEPKAIEAWGCNRPVEAVEDQLAHGIHNQLLHEHLLEFDSSEGDYRRAKKFGGSALLLWDLEHSTGRRPEITSPAAEV